MSFDKVRRHALLREQERNKKGKSGKIWEMDEIRLSIDQEADIRLLQIPDDQDPYVRNFHWPRGGPPKTCTGDIAEFSGKCAYCHYDQEHKDAERKKAEEAKARNQKYDKAMSPLSKKSETILEAIDFRFYHIVPGEGDSKGAATCNVEGPDADPGRCEFCASSNPEIAARVFGGGRRWHLKDAQLDQLFDAHKKLQRICVHVDDTGNLCGKEAYTVELLCSKCNAPVVDSEKVRRASIKELENLLKKPHVCLTCQHEDFPAQASACKSGQHEAVRGSVFDKTLRVSCSGKAKQLFGTDETYEEKIFNFDVTSHPFESVEASLDSWGFSAEDIKKFCAPIDFKWIFRPEYLDPKKFDTPDEYVAAVLDAQAESLKKPNPYGSKTPSAFKPGGGRSFTRRT